MRQYKLDCDLVAEGLPDHKEILRAELSHRYFKVLKLAGAYAFYDNTHDITEEHLWCAIRLAEDSGKAFEQILTRDKSHVRLAKYIASVDHEVTHADLADDTPFYTGSEAHKRSMLDLAIAWGYKNNVVIKKTYADNIEFLSGQSLKVTDTKKIIVSYSQDIATGYTNAKVPWDELHTLTQAKGYHFINHELVTPRRKEENCQQGFNIVVVELDI